MRKIAFFDFDGTITTEDTMLEVIKYQKGRVAFYVGFLLNAPFLIAMKLGVISKQLGKEKVLRFFFKGTDMSVFQQNCDLFTIEMLPAMIRPEALNEIKDLKASGFEVVVVSASAENWIKKWSDAVNVKLIASHLEIKNNQVTGKLDGKNCNSQEKVARIESAYNLSQYDEIYAYGDSSGDAPMLALATKAFYKPFRENKY